ncbi:MAG: Regulatory protein SoxS [Verrucomicrobiota bacterium]|jgi:AraC-like DNA-binding protein
MKLGDSSTQLLAGLAEPFTGEGLFDALPDVVFFIKNRRGEYMVVNQTLVERCGLRDKRELLGRRADEVFPAPLGANYLAQDERVVRSGEAILNQLELHFFPTGGRGWCVTNKLPLRDRAGDVVGVAGISRDLQAANERSDDYTQVAQALRQIQSHFDEPLKVKDLARQAGLSEYQFEQRVRKIFQITPGQLLQKVRMDNAVRLLRETDKAVAAVAQQCGYSDQSAFTRQFRQTTGYSPMEYRRSLRG